MSKEKRRHVDWWQNSKMWKRNSESGCFYQVSKINYSRSNGIVIPVWIQRRKSLLGAEMRQLVEADADFVAFSQTEQNHRKASKAKAEKKPRSFDVHSPEVHCPEGPDLVIFLPLDLVEFERNLNLVTLGTRRSCSKPSLNFTAEASSSEISIRPICWWTKRWGWSWRTSASG